MPREGSVISLLNSYLDLSFEVIRKAVNSRYGNGDDIRLVNLGRIVLFSNFQLPTSSGKHLEDITRAHIVSSMYKLRSSAEDINDLSIGFDRDCVRRRDKFDLNKNTKSKYHLRIMLKDVFGFAESQEKAIYALGNKLTLTRKKDEGVIDKAAGIVHARVKN